MDNRFITCSNSHNIRLIHMLIDKVMNNLMTESSALHIVEDCWIRKSNELSSDDLSSIKSMWSLALSQYILSYERTE
jgi:hypothetical protein